MKHHTHSQIECAFVGIVFVAVESGFSENDFRPCMGVQLAAEGKLFSVRRSLLFTLFVALARANERISFPFTLCAARVHMFVSKARGGWYVQGEEVNKLYACVCVYGMSWLIKN